MLFSYILLECSFMGNLPVALALCLLPFLLGWLAAYAYYKVGDLRSSVSSLTASNTSLSGELTDMRVKHTQLEAEIEAKGDQLRKVKGDLMMVESERNALREQMAATGGKAVKAAAATTILFAGTKYKTDDLKIVEGIGPKIAELLVKAGIDTWNALSKAAPERIKEILDAAGPNFQIHDPATWPQQAGLADRGEWDALKKLQDELSGGKA